MAELKRRSQGHVQQVQELERLLERAGEEVADVRQLREAGDQSERRARVSGVSSAGHLGLEPAVGSHATAGIAKRNWTLWPWWVSCVV